MGLEATKPPKIPQGKIIPAGPVKIEDIEKKKREGDKINKAALDKMKHQPKAP